MPITSMSAITPLSRYWTHEAICSEAMVITDTLDNENVQLSNVRAHMNVGISYIAELMNLAAMPVFHIWMQGSFEPQIHATGLEYIDLTRIDNTLVPPISIPPIQIIDDISRINLKPSTTTPPNTDFCSNVTKWDISELTNQQWGLNVQQRQTIAWAQIGSDLIFYVGNDITSLNLARSGSAYDITSQPIVIVGRRQPLLDDLLAENVSLTYRTNVDLPDKYIKLLIQMVQKMILEQLNMKPAAQLEQEINQGIAMISQNLASETNFEKDAREKKKYGHQQHTFSS